MPLTIIQKEAFRKYKTLRPVKLDREKIIRNYYTPGIIHNDTITCAHCGNVCGPVKKFATAKNERVQTYWSSSRYEAKPNARCPHCHRKLTTISSANYNAWIGYFAQYQRRGDWQVIRMHFVQMMPHKDREATYKIVPDNYQIWYHHSGQRVTIAPPTSFMPRRKYNPLSEWGEMNVRQDNNSEYINYDIDEFEVVSLAPWFKELITNGTMTRSDLGNFSSVKSKMELIAKMQSHPYFETLMKQNRSKLAEQISIGDMKQFHQQIRIAVFRNNLEIKDWSMYRDILRFMRELKYDMHSPKYLCPADIKIWHDHLYGLKQALDKKKEAKSAIETAKRYLKKYEKIHGKYFCIYIPTKDFVIRPIYTPMEMVEEGIHMHHCVGRYYHYKDSLILVCRTLNDERIATIEINTKEQRLIQIRGVQNSRPPQYDQIYDVLKSRMSDILHPAKYKFKHKKAA